ncbi:MAG: hypothetical protein IJ696_02220 [Ruminococcus sp.]|nr:hypothetical protein [Ruminococcus sp.]
MGAWGLKISENDIYCDIKETYSAFLRSGMSDEDAVANVINEFVEYLCDSDDAPIFWLSLAEIQWNWGRLSFEIRKKALENITLSRSEYNIYNTSTEVFAERMKILDELQEQLSAPQPKRKVFRKKKYPRCAWNNGDVFRYEFESKIAEKYDMTHKYVFIQKIGDYFDLDPDFRKIDNGRKIFGELCPVVRFWVTENKDFVLGEHNKNDCLACYGIDHADGTNSFQFYIFNLASKTDKFEFICNSKTLTPDRESMPHGEENICHINWKYFELHILNRYLYQTRHIDIMQ